MFIGKKRFYYKEVDSTNEEAKRLFREGELDGGELVIANFQNGGKGQMGSGWESLKAKNFTGTYFLKFDLDLREVFALNILTSLAVRETVAEFISGSVEIKWPNDILVNGEKIAGILIETIVKDNKVKGAFLGIGLNVNQSRFSKFHRKPTSIKKFINAKLDLEVIIERLSFYLQQFHSLYLIKGYDTINFLYHKELYLKGEEHVYRVGKDTRCFILQNVNKQGDLQLFNQFGKIEEFGLKEIEFLI